MHEPPKKEKWDSEANHHPAKFKMAAPAPAPMRGVMKLREMDEKNMHNLFLKNMAGLIEEIKNPSPCTNP